MKNRTVLRINSIIYVVALAALNGAPVLAALPTPVKYNWNVNLDYDESSLSSTCELTVKNSTESPIQTLPLLLYRLMTVDSVVDGNGRKLGFTQNVRAFDDFDRQQVNFIEVKLYDNLAPNQSATLKLKYRGYLAGYVETGMRYVRETIDPEFTILRLDCYAYPVVGTLSYAANRAEGLRDFEFVAAINVPDSLVVVNVGRLDSVSAHDGRAAYHYRSLAPSWRMDFAIAQYANVELGANTIYYLPGDSSGAVMVADAMRRCLDKYTEWFGPLTGSNGFTVIEIPDGFGSQADATGILQTASAFKDQGEMRQLYHELSHCWNVKETDAARARWQEGLATFLEYLTADSLDNANDLDRVAQWYLQNIREKSNRDSTYLTIVPADYGRHHITGRSYSVHMISSHVLRDVVGHNQFCRIFRTFYEQYGDSGATLAQLSKHSTTVAGHDLEPFFQDWFFTTRAISRIRDGQTLDQLAAYYK